MVLVDFEKAFDSISWEYISKILKAFNFNQKTIAVIKSLQINSKSKIVQNGHLSDFINLGRGYIKHLFNVIVMVSVSL